MIIAISGGTGFIGKQLVLRHLAAGDEVRVLSRRPAEATAMLPGVRVFAGDLAAPCDEVLLPFLDGADTLYHCAAEIGRETAMVAVNSEGTAALAKAASGRIGTWVQLSSVGVYGQELPPIVTEAAPLNPQNEYERTKAAGDLAVMAQAEAGAFPCAVLRPSIVIGEDMPARWLSQMMAMIARGLFFYIGRPGASANYIPVANVVDALVVCATSTQQSAVSVYNLSDWTTLESFVTAVAGGMGSSPPRLRLPEWLVRAGVTAASAIGRPPLTQARVDALTSRVRYATDRIEQSLGYRRGASIEETAFRIAKRWKASRAP